MTHATEITLPPRVLRKLARLHARVEGGQAVQQGGANALQLLQSQLQEAILEMCEETGLPVPNNGNAPLDVDWSTGRVTSQGGPPHD